MEQTEPTTPTFPDAACAFSHKPSLDLLHAQGVSMDVYIEGEQRRLISEALEKTQGNKAHAANLLGVQRTTLTMRMQRLFR